MQKLLMTDLPTWFMPVVGYPQNYWMISNKAIQDYTSSKWTGPMAQVGIKSGK